MVLDSENKKVLAAALMILSAVAVSYYGTLSHGFIVDDTYLVAGNPNIKHWGNLWRIFTTGYWDAEGVTRGLYRPFTIFTFLVEYSIAGTRPFLYHLDNLILHFACTFLFYLILKALVKEGEAPLYAALLFAVYPVHTEAVSWVAGRAELLSAAFSLLAFYIAVKRPYGTGPAVLSSVSFLLALLSKESAAVMPVLLAAYVLVFGPSGPWRVRLAGLARRLFPYAAVFVLVFAARFFVLGSEMSPQGIDQALYGVGPYGRFLTMCRAFYEYIRLGFLPFGLKLDYFFPPPESVWGLRVMFPIAALTSLLIFAPVIRKSGPVLFAILWFFIALLPVSGIIPTGVIMSERAMYLPSAGSCMLLGLALSSMGRYTPSRKNLIGPVLLAAIVTTYAAVTLHRDRVWKNEGTYVQEYFNMLRKDIKSYPGYVPLYKTMARMQIFYGNDWAEKEKAVKEAVARTGPEDDELRAFMAEIYAHNRMPEKALEEINAAIRLNHQSGYYNFAGKLLVMLRRGDEAERMMDMAIWLNPNSVQSYMDKGEIMMGRGDDYGALRCFERAAELDPGDHDAYLEQGIILDSKRQYGPAIEKIRTAVGLRPDIPDLHYFLAVAYLDAGMTEPAKAELEEALRLKPGYVEAETLLQKVR